MLVSQNTNFKTDFALGLKSQNDILSILKSAFNSTIVETSERFCKWDFEDIDGNHYELKSRRTSKNCYPTTLLPVHKIMRTNAKQYFIFKFADKLTFIEYDESIFKTFETGMITDARMMVGELHYYIPVGLLTDIP